MFVSDDSILSINRLHGKFSRLFFTELTMVKWSQFRTNQAAEALKKQTSCLPKPATFKLTATSGFLPHYRKVASTSYICRRSWDFLAPSPLPSTYCFDSPMFNNVFYLMVPYLRSMYRGLLFFCLLIIWLSSGDLCEVLRAWIRYVV